MATPMFRDLSRALEAPEEGRELWSGIPADEEPAYAEEIFRKASDAAVARENALPKTGYVPAGVGPMVEPSMESTLAPLSSGLRSRKPVDFTSDTTKLQGKLSGFLGGNQILRGPEYGRPLSDEEFASEQERARKLMAQDGLARDIPVASAEGSKTLASTVPGSGGDDELGRLSMGQALVRALEGSGSVISGQNLRSGAADTLVDRMKQIEALRAKKEERAADVAQEQAQYEGANLATLTTQLAAFKDRPDIVAALQNLRPGAKYTKPSDFIKSAYQAVTNPPTVAGKEAIVKKTGAQIVNEEGKPEIAKGTLEVKRGALAERERANKAREAIQRQAHLVKKASDTKVGNDVRAAGKNVVAAEKAITRAMETAEGDKLGIIGNIRDFQGLESVAPGFTQGKVPSWLGQGSIDAAREVPALNKQATQLSSALETFIAGIRKSLFGASLTGNEKASFDAIVSSGLLMPPDVLAANINRLRQGAAKFAQNHFSVASTLHPDITNRVLGNSALLGPALSEGGIYSDVWTLPKAPAVGGGIPAPISGMTRMIGTDGNKYDVPNNKVEAAKAKGWKE